MGDSSFGGLSDYATVGVDAPLYPGGPNVIPYGPLGRGQNTLHGFTTQNSRVEAPTALDVDPTLSKSNTFDLEALAKRVVQLEKEQREEVGTEIEEEDNETDFDFDSDKSELMEDIGGKYDEAIAELTQRKQALEVDRLGARNQLKAVDSDLRRVNRKLSRLRAKKKFDAAGRRGKGAIRFFRKRVGISDASDISMSIKAEGVIPKKEKILDETIGRKFPYNVLECNDEDDVADMRKVSENFFKHQFNLDFSENNPDVTVDEDGARTIAGAVKMVPFGVNKNINHMVDSTNTAMGEHTNIGDHVYEGGYMLVVLKPTKMGGVYEATRVSGSSSVVPKGAKMMHGRIVVVDDKGNTALVFVGGTRTPIHSGSSEKMSYDMYGHMLGDTHHSVKMTRDVSHAGYTSGGRKVVMKTAIRGM